jgi:mono/diheme cytochrome c family protein
VLLGLSTGHAIGLGLIAAAFVVFSLLCALVIPKRWPQFPGERGLRWFIVVTVVLCIGTLAAVEVFATEAEEETAQAETTGTTTTGTTTTGTTSSGATTTNAEPPAPPEGESAAGKPVFSAQGCGGCHAFKAAGSNGAIGPDLDTALQGKDAAFVRESIVDPNKDVASGYQPNIMPGNFGQTLTPKQIDDLVAFLTKPS